MNNPKHLTVKVRCPRTQRIQTMSVTFVDNNDKDFPLPVNGCDDLCGNKICEKCSAAITLLFFHGYTYSNGEIIHPSLESPKEHNQ